MNRLKIIMLSVIIGIAGIGCSNLQDKAINDRDLLDTPKRQQDLRAYEWFVAKGIFYAQLNNGCIIAVKLDHVNGINLSKGYHSNHDWTLHIYDTSKADWAITPEYEEQANKMVHDILDGMAKESGSTCKQ